MNISVLGIKLNTGQKLLFFLCPNYICSRTK